MEEEIWLPASGLECRVEVSNLGNLRSVPRSALATRNGKQHAWTLPGKPIRPYITKNGYLEVQIMIERARRKYSVHRLVAQSHVPGFASGLSVNHINGVKTDNRAINLEWVSLADNSRHQWRTGLVDLRGEKQPTSKLNAKQVIAIRRLLRAGVSGETLALIAGVSPSLIRLIRDGKRWAHLECSVDGE